MSWRGIDGAVAAAKAGHDTVLSPAPELYFDHWQSAGDLSPGRSNTLSLEDGVPVRSGAGIHARASSANTCSVCRRISGPSSCARRSASTYMAFPRIAALAEVAWSPPKRIDWDGLPATPGSAARALRHARHPLRARSRRWSPGRAAALSHDLEQCGDGYLLSLEDDAPIEGERAVFLVNITESLLDLARRGPDQGQVDPRHRRSDSVQLPDRQGRGEDSAAQARDPRRRARDPARRLQEAPVASASLEPAVANTGSRRCRRSIIARRRASTTCVSVHARQGRSDLGHRQHRAGRE